MRYTTSGVLLLLALISLALLTTSAARPFERVASGDSAYGDLNTLSQAGLLAGFDMPAGELSRLEIAVLAQKALGGYGTAQLGGGASDVLVEDALNGLLSEFAEELSQLGVAPVALTAVPQEGSDIERRIAYLEAQADGSDDSADGGDGGAESAEASDSEDSGEEIDLSENATLASENAGPDVGDLGEEPPAVEVQMYGSFRIHAKSEETQLIPSGTLGIQDVELYWGELGWDIAQNNWAGHFSVQWDDFSEDVELNEFYTRYQNPVSGWFGQVGQVNMPWGNNNSYFATYAAVNDLSYTTARSIATGVENENWGIGAWLFNPELAIVGQEDSMRDYAGVWDITKRQADECHNGWQLTAGYISHLASSDLRLAGEGPHHKRVPAYNVFGSYDWDANRWHVLADYTQAAQKFDALDMDTNEDGIGDQPSALNTELVYEPLPDTLYGINYQATSQFADYASSRWGVLYGRKLGELVELKLEYTHGEFGSYVTANQASDDRIVAEFAVEF